MEETKAKIVHVNTHLNDTIDAIPPEKIKLDENVKEYLSDIQILARIVKYTVHEVSHLSIEQIMECIISDSIEVGKVKVDPGLTNTGKVESIQTENNILNEGQIRFDIRFALCYEEKRYKLIINVEAQNNTSYSKLKYHLESRMVYYLSRLISAQKQVEFFHDDYDNIKKVYSIWICMDTEKDEDSITEIVLKPKTIYGKSPELVKLDKMCGVIIRLRKEENVNQSKNKLIAMLEDLLRKEDSTIKKQKMMIKYNMKMTKELERRVDKMCNYSDVIEERGIKKGIEQGVSQGITALVETLKELDQSTDVILSKIMEKFDITEEKAKSYL